MVKLDFLDFRGAEIGIFDLSSPIPCVLFQNLKFLNLSTIPFALYVENHESEFEISQREILFQSHVRYECCISRSLRSFRTKTRTQLILKRTWIIAVPAPYSLHEHGECLSWNVEALA